MATNYFENFSDTVLKNVKIKNIFNKIVITNKGTNNLFLAHTLNDDETPETIAQQYYGDKRFYWIILLANNVKDYFYDFPLTVEQLNMYVDKVWASDYEPLVGTTGFTTTKQEIFDELNILNEQKKKIKYLNPAYLEKFLFELNNLVQSGGL